MTKGRIVTTGVALAALVLAGLAFAQDKAEKPKRDTIQANVINMNAGPKTGLLTIWIDDYTSDEDAARYLKTLVEQGQEAVVKLWQEEKPVAGRLRFASTLGYDLRVARSLPNEKGRLIRLVTDRPIQGFELMNGLRSKDYPIGWIEIQLDADGKGEGQMIAAAELEAKDGSIVFKSFGVQPMRITNAKLTTK